ncbi:type IV secretory system conjugative DNA transfer family protein [Methylovulum psychrotolerans]|uniref:AAA+ ATPase domain-containing protein n=1 Tax=Methylovulum psychrotolerans TaxID=1704499 RepID=A0A2S5CG71_9GAMM|nr:DUF87 domain-containing protein [Methylovulum psychrotolerans]POZ49800.1 hypothetical protein AADEFJLK_04415 [Methylovulum psychrotolerans]
MQRISDKIIEAAVKNTFGRCIFGGMAGVAAVVTWFIAASLLKIHLFPWDTKSICISGIIGFSIASLWVRLSHTFNTDKTGDEDIDRKELETGFICFSICGLALFIAYLFFYFYNDIFEVLHIPPRSQGDSFEMINNRLSWMIFAIFAISVAVSYPLQIIAKHVVPLIISDVTRIQEKNRRLLNRFVQNQARSLYPILTEHLALGGEETLSLARPHLLPFIDLLCAVNGQETRLFFEYEKNNRPDTWPSEFADKHAQQFMTLTDEQLAIVPYGTLKQFFLSVFSEPYDIHPKDLAITDENLKWCKAWYKEDLKTENDSRRANRLPPLPASGFTEEVAKEILLRSLIENRSVYRHREFERYRDDLRLDCTDRALAVMGRSRGGIVYGRPLAGTDYRGIAYPIRSAYDCVATYDDDIFRHTYIVGKTGSGKTTLLKTLISQHIQAGQGVIVMSPESDLFEAVLDCVPPSRAADVIHFDPVSSETPVISVNPFTLEKGELLFERAGEVYATLEAAFSDMTESMKTLLFKCTFTLLQIPGANLQDLRRLLKAAPDFRHAVIANRSVDADTREWWRDTYGAKGSQYQKSAEALIRRLEAFSVPPLSSTLASASFDFPEALNGQKSIFLFDLSRLKGLQAEVTGQLLSSMVLQTLLARDSQKPQDRLPYHLIIDEFQTYAGSSAKSFIDLFNRARKYKMSVTLAHQVTANIPPELLSTIIGNSGTKIIMERPSEDAGFFAKELQIKSIDYETMRVRDDRDTTNASILQNLEPHEFFLSTPRNKRGMILRTMFENYKPIEIPLTMKWSKTEETTVYSREEWRGILTGFSRTKYGAASGGQDNQKNFEEVKNTNAKSKPTNIAPTATDDDDTDPEGRFSIV